MVFIVYGFALIKGGHIALGFLVILMPSIVITIHEIWTRVRRRRAASKSTARRLAVASASSPPLVSPALRAELDQTPEWWDQQFEALLRSRIPRDPEFHRGHDIEEPIAFYAAGYGVESRCLECGVSIRPNTPS